MSQAHALQVTDACAQVRTAVRERTPATLAYHTGRDWVTVKTRFAALESTSVMLGVDWPATPDNAPDLPEAGQEIGVSFRRGSRKCVFTSCLAEVVELTTRSGGTRKVLHLTWPQDVQELQRRLYHRIPVPQGRIIPVDLWASTGENQAGTSTARQGRMVDISAGGLSIELPRDVRPRWREETQLACRFRPDERQEPLEVAARLTNRTPLADGRVRLGLQFLGLDANEQGRRTLQRISRLATCLRS